MCIGYDGMYEYDRFLDWCFKDEERMEEAREERIARKLKFQEDSIFYEDDEEGVEEDEQD